MELMLHPADAARRGIADGDLIIAYNDLAQVEFTARLTEWVAEGAAAAAGVYSAALPESGETARSMTHNRLLVNALHHGRLSDIGEATTLNDNTIEVRPAYS